MKLLSNILLKAGLIVEGTTNLQGTATTVTQASADNSTKLATTAFVKNQAYAVDSAVVHTTGDESISGVKTFLGSLYVGNSSTNGVFRIYASGGEYGQIAKATGGGLNFTINAGANRLVTFGTGTDGLYIDNGTGNVTLNYSGSGGRSFIARVNNSSVSNGPQIEMFQTTTYATINAGKYGGTGVAVPIALAIDGTQRLVVFTDGNTTVGSTTNAGFKFDVNGTARVQGDTTITGNLNVGSSSSFRATIQSAANDVLSSSLYLNNINAGASAASYLQFGASGASSWLGLYSSVHSNPSWAGRLLIGMGSSGNGITISASGGASQDILFAVQTGTVMRMMPNRNVLVDKVTDSGLAKFQVNGAIQQTSVLSSMLMVNSSGVLVSATAGVDYQAAGSYVPTARQLTINGTAYDLSADRSWTIDAGGATASTRTIQKFTSTASQTTFTITGGYTVGMVDVFLNGTKLDNATDFTATNGTTVVLTDALASGQCVEVYKYGSQFIVNNGLRQTTLFSATAGQTTFTVNYSAGMVDVFYNGSKLDSSEYTATDGTSIVLGTACAVNDKLEVVAYSYTVGAFTGQAQLNGTGFVKVNGTTVTYDNTSYLPLTGGTVSNTTSAGNPNVLTIKNNTTTDNGYAYSTLALDTTLANTMADIRLGSTTPLGIRIYAATSPLTATPTGAGFQLFSNSHPSFSGQVYFDSGAHNSAALIFRTAATGGTITERFRISATGAATFSSSVFATGLGVGVSSLSAWSTVLPMVEGLSGTSVGYYNNSGIPIMYLNANAYFNGTNWIYKTSGKFATTISVGAFDSTSAFEVNTTNATGTAGSAAPFTRVFNIAQNGAATFANTVSTTGVAFPASQVSSSNPNTLDDYEEGTWTPILQGGGGVAAYSTRDAWYTKVGRVVTITWFISFTKNTIGGTMQLANLPFTLLDGSGIFYPQGTVLLDNLAVATNNIIIQGANATVNADFIESNGSTGNHAGLAASKLGSGTMACRGTLTYFTS